MKRKINKKALFAVLDAIFFLIPPVFLVLFWEAGQAGWAIKILLLVIIIAQDLIILSTAFFKDRMLEIEKEENESLKRLLIEMDKEFHGVLNESREKDNQK